ncbi:MAG: hypothetical protein M1830_004757 [Pleopsidium flavum]|nr:MAG: hypothetical protein M1830_004757 [Pleopsidium flavum]
MRLTIPLATLSSLPFLLASPFSVKLLAEPAPSSLHLGARAPKTYCPARPASEAYQRAIFAGFINTLYGEENVSKAFDTYVDINLIGHDPFDPQGRDANSAKLSNIIPYAQFTVLRSSFDANIGLAHAKVDEDSLIALADIYRMHGTCIVEHWDVTQARPVNATNPIAMF